MAIAYKTGGNCDAWCGRCKMVLAHTIEAMVGADVVRVNCNTCRSQHGYKAFPPGEAPKQVRERAERGPLAPQPGKARASDYEQAMKGRNLALAKRYSPKDKYAAGDIIDHPSFGVGVVTALKDTTKVETLFREGPKVLVHGK